MTSGRTTVLVLAVVGLFGCADASTSAPKAPGSPDAEPEVDPQIAAASALYAEHCASCHGDVGEGRSAPAVAGWPRGREALIAAIDATMPQGAPERCAGQCATDVADFVLTLPTPHVDIDCSGPRAYPPQRIRLLNRREYRRTVEDLLGLSISTCASLTDCALSEQSCVQNRCVADPCGLHTFVFDAGDRTPQTVHVAGSFNDWPGTIEDGGWAMARLENTNLWILKQPVQPGETHPYKFVVDGSEWLADASNPNSADDGFGGVNSVLTIQCDSDESGDITADFPPETRPQGYAFDNHADAGRVTATHVEEHMNAAAILAEDALQNPSDWLPCDLDTADDACVSTFVQTFGKRAFRRPLTPAEVARYTAHVQNQDNRRDGFNVALQAFLISPHFLYRTEIGVAQGGHFQLTSWELASSLSYALWGTMPDDALFEAAESGALSTPQGLETHATRMLDDPRARDVVGTFAIQWLGVEKILSVDKRPDLYHGFNQAVRQAMLDETRQFVTHVVFDATSRFDELLTADYTLATETLSSFYELPLGPNATPYSHGRRAGVLGHGSLLATTAHSDQTSPILRGVFVRERLLCQDLGTPPAEAGGVPDVDPNATTRERFRQHSDDPSCRSCHQYIDGLGFGFERFDPVGRWRDTEHGQPIDPTGELIDVEGLRTGTEEAFDSLPGLAQMLADSRAARDCYASQVFRFFMGAHETQVDACALSEIQTRFADSGDDLQALLLAIVTSEHFARRSAP